MIRTCGSQKGETRRNVDVTKSAGRVRAANATLKVRTSRRLVFLPGSADAGITRSTKHNVVIVKHLLPRSFSNTFFERPVDEFVELNEFTRSRCDDPNPYKYNINLVCLVLDSTREFCRFNFESKDLRKKRLTGFKNLAGGFFFRYF